ncbi:MAG: hypothetical protein KA247_04060 [Bacteroidetes bacterium]|nr:hypothetical protein [Bacteroidota bacterium]
MMKALFKRWELVYMLCGISAMIVIQQFTWITEFIRSGTQTQIPAMSYGITALRTAWGIASVIAVNNLINSVRSAESEPVPAWVRILAIANVIVLILGSFM